jgi:hypothetical protein
MQKSECNETFTGMVENCSKTDAEPFGSLPGNTDVDAISVEPAGGLLETSPRHLRFDSPLAITGQRVRCDVFASSYGRTDQKIEQRLLIMHDEAGRYESWVGLNVEI